MNVREEKEKLAAISEFFKLIPAKRAEFVNQLPTPELRQSLRPLLKEMTLKTLNLLKDPFQQVRDDEQDSCKAGPWQLGERIGEGGASVVYKARHRTTGQLAAVKIAKPGLAARLSLKKEHRLLQRLQDAHILKTLDYEDHQTCAFVANSFVGGDTLKVVRTRGHWSKDRITECFRQLCLAVQVLHDNHIVHRDLKPQNIMWDSQDQLTLIDLGAATVVGNAQLDKSWQPTGFTRKLITPCYAAPEQFAMEEATFANDIYALGLILGFLITGSAPRSHPIKKHLKKLVGKALKAKDHWPQIRCQKTLEVLDKALDRTPQARHLRPVELHRDYYNNMK